MKAKQQELNRTLNTMGIDIQLVQIVKWNSNYAEWMGEEHAYTVVSFLCSANPDFSGCRVPEIYRIPCECEAAYIGQTGRTITMRLSEHQRSIRLMQPEKSGLAEHYDGRHQWRTHKNSSAEPIVRPAVNQPNSTKQDDTSAAFMLRNALIRANQRTAPLG
ncbi:hypothetical protein ANN_02522 [Periplaneta americana]|uniref:Uncharacterized protein n=1 Tax=Periplaneta americana TaxID=6978 RepID=A0ABQ8TZZ4_PERAM|nr:hypothetical protein ANN_02522 [Periplaneta americana]